MEIVLKFILAAAVSYIVGAIPTGFIFGKVLKGIDIRQHGSGNTGATNAFRVLGKGPGTAVLVIDILKGAIPVAVFGLMFAPDVNIPIVAAVGAVAGHNWTCFLEFKGGKGVATTLGVLVGLTVAIPSIRLAVLLCLLAWIMCFLITAYISVSSIFAAVLLPILMVVVDAPFQVKILGIVFCFFVVLRHRPNIQRLVHGQEPRVSLPFHKK
jgi:glycerol-3-phosphate acyltransferase PlsY